MPWSARQGRDGRNLRRLNKNAEAAGMMILAIWPVAKSAIEARPCTDLAGKCPPGIKLFGQGWRPDQPNRGKHRGRRLRASVSRSRAGAKAILPVSAPGEADYPAGLAPITAELPGASARCQGSGDDHRSRPQDRTGKGPAQQSTAGCAGPHKTIY